MKQPGLNDPIDCNGLVNTIKKTLYGAMDHYWENITAPGALFSSLLDPRMKNLSFVSDIWLSDICEIFFFLTEFYFNQNFFITFFSHSRTLM